MNDATDLELLQEDLRVIEEEILPDLRQQLTELTSPDYKAEENQDHNLRDQDIEWLQSQIHNYERIAARRRKQIENERLKEEVCDDRA
jgi:hypothetical protein